MLYYTMYPICQELYKRWLCATKLTFYSSPPNSTTTTDDDDDPTSSSDGAGMEESGGPGRLRPCIGVCEDVLQSCPYYHPSRFQGDKSVIYGGYPAFDCPSKQWMDGGGGGGKGRGGG